PRGRVHAASRAVRVAVGRGAFGGRPIVAGRTARGAVEVRARDDVVHVVRDLLARLGERDGRVVERPGRVQASALPARPLIDELIDVVGDDDARGVAPGPGADAIARIDRAGAQIGAPRLRAELRRDRRGERGTERVGALEAAEVAAVGAAPAG